MKMTADKLIESTICHEWGHVLMYFLLTNGTEYLEGFEIVDSVSRVDGHTTSMPTYIVNGTPIPKKCEILTLFGGRAAEYICGYLKSKLPPKGTDAEKIKALVTRNRRAIVKERKEQAIEMLMPYKNALEWLTEKTVLKFNQENEDGYYRLFRDEMIAMLHEALAPTAAREKAAVTE